MNSQRAFLALLRLELADALRSRWVAFTATVYVALTLAFVWLGLHESSVLGFTGLSRVLLNVTSAVVLVCPLLVLIGTHAAVVRARSSGFCELLLSLPVPRATWFGALLVSRLLILVGPLFVMLVACALGALLSAERDAELLSMALRSLSICGSLVFAFVGMGLLLSSLARSSDKALVSALLLFAFTAALHDVLLISVLLRSALPAPLVFALAALNPTEAARVGILSSVDPELAALGPVGFWLANSLGAKLSFLLASGWPLLLGALCSALAAARVKRMDLVA